MGVMTPMHISARGASIGLESRPLLRATAELYTLCAEP